MRGTAPLARIIALVAIVAAAVLRRGRCCSAAAAGGYTVKARFENASQLVKGNLVQVSGIPAGKVKDIQLTRDGQAELTLSIDDDYAPLRARHAGDRPPGLAVGRRQPLRRPHACPAATPPKIPDGGVIDQDATTTAVDLDQIFNTFDPSTRTTSSRSSRARPTSTDGRARQMNAGLLYLNPSLQASSRAVPRAQLATRRCSSASSSPPPSSSPTSPTATTTSPASSTTSRRRRTRSAREQQALAELGRSSCRRSCAAPTRRS